MTNDEISRITMSRLSNALKREMRRKPFSKITVTNIINDCNVNRNTFYYHFRNIEDLLEWTFEQDAINVLKSMDLIARTEDAIRFIFDYIDNNKILISCACNSLGREQLKHFFYTDMKSLVESNLSELEKNSRLPMGNNERELFSILFTEGIAGLFLAYVNNPNRWSKNEIVKMTGHILNRFKIFIAE